MWLLYFLWEVLRDFLIWGFAAKRILRWLTPHVPTLARLRAEHRRYVLAQIASQSGEERGVSERDASCSVPLSIRRLPLMRRIELEFSLWLWGGALK